MKHAFNYCCIVSKDTVEITVEQKRINNALFNHQIGYESNQWLSKLGAIQKRMYADRCMLILEKASILKSTRMTEALKWLKKGPVQQNVVRAQYQL